MSSTYFIFFILFICLKVSQAISDDSKRFLANETDYLHNLENKVHQLTSTIQDLTNKLEETAAELKMETFRCNSVSTNLTERVKVLEQYNNTRRACESGLVNSRYDINPAAGALNDNIHVTFKMPFRNPPIVAAGLTGIDAYANRNFRIITYATSVTSRGFQLVFHDWADSITYRLSAYWIACPKE